MRPLEISAALAAIVGAIYEVPPERPALRAGAAEIRDPHSVGHRS
ncbi:MAG: hypothetical protein ABR569_14490 [Gaiellaceae bacterium]